MIKKIILLTESPFTLRDYKRFGVEIYGEHGIEVEVWDLTGIFHPGYDIAPQDPCDMPFIKKLGSKNEALKRIAALNGNDDFVLQLNNAWLDKLWFFQALSEHKIRYGFTAMGIVPLPKKEKKTFLARVKGFKLIKLQYLLENILHRIINKLPYKVFGVSPAALLLAGGEMSLEYYYYPVDAGTEIIWTHSHDYNLYLEENGKKDVSPSGNAVFLDTYMPFHPDAILVGESNPVTAGKYYPSLRGFFDRVEKEQNVKVEIAAHPRSDYKDDYFKGRRIFYGKTIERVRAAKFVIADSSTSINFAVLYNKPVIFVITSEMADNQSTAFVNAFAHWLGKKPINVDRHESIDWDEELKVDTEKYQHYKNEIIKKEGTADVNTWETLCGLLKNI